MNENVNISSEKILNVIYSAIDALNNSLPKEKRVEKSPHASLFDNTGAIDSLGLTLLVVGLEEKIEEQLGARVTLVSGEAMSQDEGPFRNVDSLTKYIAKLINEQNG